MQHLFTPRGEAALAALLRRRPVFGFDFDGTLAPIVERPDEACIPAVVAERLHALMAHFTVAIISGRAVADVRGRLGFEPHHVIGSHGAEDTTSAEAAAAAAAHAAALDPLREQLRRHAGELAAAGVTVEDKRQSIALHYRRAPDPAMAQALLRRLFEPAPGDLSIFAGKAVLNLAAREAPDKAVALAELVRRAGADCAFFAGDDVNDEPVFASAPDDWLTVHVGRGPSQARFCLDGPPEMALLLERVLKMIR